MRRPLLLPAAAALALGACAHAGSKRAEAEPPAIEVTNPIRHAVSRITYAPGFAGADLASAFEQLFCNRLFNLNKHQAICADEVQAYIEAKRQAAMLSGAGESVEALYASLDAPRRVDLSATQTGEDVAITLIVQDRGGATLGRLQVVVKKDGSDLPQRANEAAIEVLKLK